MKYNEIEKKYPVFYKYYKMLEDYRDIVDTNVLEAIPESFMNAIELEIYDGNIRVYQRVESRIKVKWDITLGRFIGENL
ncbi:MAG: hypothetical protein WC877_02085 [Dehalococcoidales bacterium]|jgi:hypothetical protein